MSARDRAIRKASQNQDNKFSWAYNRGPLNSLARGLRTACAQAGNPDDLVAHFKDLIELLNELESIASSNPIDPMKAKKVRIRRNDFFRRDIHLGRKYKFNLDFSQEESEEPLTPAEKRPPSV